ncbi:flagellar hook assembly protein FlgD [Pseudaeromonas pectinilytica]
MQVQAIGSDLTDSSSGLTTNQQLSQNDFIKLFMSQLTYQDPLEPVDNSQFLAQLAQFSSVEQNRAMNEKLDNLLSIGTTFQAASLVGKSVEITSNSTTSIGVISAVSFSSDGPVLTVKLDSGDYINNVELSQISKISSS